MDKTVDQDYETWVALSP